MKNWFSQLLDQTPEGGRNAVRLAFTFMVAAALAVLVFAFVAVQSGAWQAYAVVAAFVGFFVVQAFVIKFARQNQLNAAGVLLMVGGCYVVLAMTSMMAGIGLGLSIALTVVIVEIAFETFSGSRVTRAIISGFAFSIVVFLMDRFASWNRPSFPVVQNAIPAIAAGTVITIAFLVIRRNVIWRDLRLARKLLIAFSALAMLALVVGIVANLGLNSVKNSYEHSLSDGEALKSTSLTLSNNLLLARRHEKDFIARWHDEGFDTAYTNYVVPNQQAVAEIRKNIIALSTFAPTVGETFSATYPQTQYESDLASLKQSTDLYEQNFQKMVQLSKERGFQDTGLEGQFRTDVHNIEDRIYGREGLDPIVITMLQIRRHEKDYLLRGDQTYIDQTHQSVIDLKQQVASSDVLTATEKKDITALADQYVISFDALVAKDVEVAAAIQAFRDAAHTMEPLVAKLTTTGADLSQSDVTTARTSSSRTLLYSSVTLLAALLVAIFLSVILSRQITKPVISLTNTAQIISEGKFDVQAEVTSGDEIGSLAQNFNIMTARLAQAFEDVRRRAAELATVAEVSTATATILEVKNLLQEVVDLTKERFSLYHSHIYLLDEARENLVLASGAGEAGRQMVAEGRSIPLNREQSLVARAAREQKGVTVNDVTQAPDFLPNPLLPDTRSELAVPMIVGGNVIGVFDIQSDQVGRFTESDVNIQTTLAAQLATSIQNVRSFEQSKTQADFESLVNTIGQKIQRAPTVEDTLQVAIRELGSALGASRVKATLSTRSNGGSATSTN